MSINLFYVLDSPNLFNIGMSFTNKAAQSRAEIVLAKKAFEIFSIKVVYVWKVGDIDSIVKSHISVGGYMSTCLTWNKNIDNKDHIQIKLFFIQMFLNIFVAKTLSGHCLC